MKTIVFNLFNGFNVRYLIETGIISNLKKKNKIILTSYSFDDFKEFFKNDENIIFYKFEKQKDAAFKKSIFYRNLNTIKYYIHGGDFKTPSLHYQIFEKDYYSKSKYKISFYIFFLKTILLALNKFKFLRILFSHIIETQYPSYYNDLFQKYKIDKVVCSSLGTFVNDDFLMRAAKKKNIKTLGMMLSWDNSTTRGYPGCKPTNVFAWTETMKREIEQLSDINGNKIYVTGSAQFDHYFHNLIITKKSFEKKFNLDEKKNTLFFATRGPNTFASNPEIINTICKAIKNNQIKNSQLIVRIHPLHYTKDKIKNYEELFKFYNKLEIEFKDILKINYPIFRDSKNNLFLEKENTLDLHALLKYSDVVINVFSTINIEGAIFNKPLINICYQTNSDFYNKNIKSRYDIKIDYEQDHNQRILKTGGVTNCWNDKELINGINLALNYPEKLSNERQQILYKEVGPNKGKAAQKISRLIEELI